MPRCAPPPSSRSSLSLGACSASVSTGSDDGYDADKIAEQVQAAQEKVTPDLDVTDPTCPTTRT